MLGTWMSLPMLSLLTMVLCVAPWLFAPTVMPFGKRFRLILISNVISFLEKKKARKTISFDFWIHSENFWGVLFLQEYLNVRFKETGHSNMYFPQVCVVALIYDC